MSDLMKDLDDLFQEVNDGKDSFETLPDGEYLAEITGAEYKESKNSGRPMVQIAMKVLSGEYEGRYHSRFLMLTGRDEVSTRRNLNMLAKQLLDLGLDTSGSLEETLDNVPVLEGLEVNMKIETVDSKGREFVNTFITLAE